MSEQVEIREPISEDEAFVCAAWLNSYKMDSLIGRKIVRGIFFDYEPKIIRKILNRADIRIASPINDKEVIVGFLVKEGSDDKPTIHFLFVKEAFRKMGIATALVSGLNIARARYTYFTDHCFWIREKYPRALYNPYLVEEQNETN